MALLHWLQLAMTPGIGPMLSRRLIDAAGGDAELACASSVDVMAAIRGIGSSKARHLGVSLSRAKDEALVEMEKCERLGVRLICPEDDEYPILLKTIDDPPNVLWVRGAIEPRDLMAVAIVGSRKCSMYGREQAERFGGLIAGAGLTVISGGARGIDAAAHRGAIQMNAGRTIAVLGCGVDVAYPAENQSLFAEIAGPIGVEYANRAADDRSDGRDRGNQRLVSDAGLSDADREAWLKYQRGGDGAADVDRAKAPAAATERAASPSLADTLAASEFRGAVISEYPLGTPPIAENFPRRNRIVSGMSRGVLVVEADIKSGALITARLAGEDHGRTVFAVPGRVDNPLSEGPHQLIRDGATIATKLEDILNGFTPLPMEAMESATALEQADEDERLLSASLSAASNGDRESASATSAPPISSATAELTMSPSQRAVFEAIGSEPATVDALIESTGLPAGQVLRELTVLSLKAVVRRVDGQTFQRARR